MNRADYMKKIEEFKEEKRWCEKHPTGYWGKDQWGNWYTQCAIGHRLNQQCKVGGEKHG
jgi:hypothetical protein